MRVKYIFSVIGTFFMAATAKSQQTQIPVRKETTQQVNNNLKGASLPGNDIQIKHGEISGKHLPHKDNEGVMGKHIAIDKSSPQLLKDGFASGTIGDMPIGWKTNGSGELVTVKGQPGKWLKLDENTKYETTFNNELPANFIVEFDMILNYNEGQNVPDIAMKLLGKGKDEVEPALTLTLSPNRGSTANPARFVITSTDEKGKEKFRSAAKSLPTFLAKNGKDEPVHITISVKGPHVKAWLDGEKIYDLQDAVLAGSTFNKLAFETAYFGGSRDHFNYYITNVNVKGN